MKLSSSRVGWPSLAECLLDLAGDALRSGFTGLFANRDAEHGVELGLALDERLDIERVDAVIYVRL
jgi:hypothetical protein